jgi:hypothetical protein
MRDDSGQGFFAFEKRDAGRDNWEFFGLGRHAYVSKLPRRGRKEAIEG